MRLLVGQERPRVAGSAVRTTVEEFRTSQLRAVESSVISRKKTIKGAVVKREGVNFEGSDCIRGMGKVKVARLENGIRLAKNCLVLLASKKARHVGGPDLLFVFA
ncbi:MAG: hypothetical protein AAGC68_06055, partial [Verrucomicrobiota bacterium]